MIKIKEGFKGQRSVVLPKAVVEIGENDPIISALLITDIGYYPHAEYHYVNRSVPIDQYVLIYCVEGSGHYKVGDKEYDVTRNQYFILPANVSHIYYSNENAPWTLYWIHFKGSLAAYYADGALRPQTIMPGLNSRITYRNGIFEEIFSILSSGYDLDCLRYASSAFFHYIASMRYLQKYRNSNTISGTDKPVMEKKDTLDEETIISAIEHYMEENIERRISVDEMAMFIGYSVSHFTKVFRKATGTTPYVYFNKMKIAKACELLRTDMKINQICHKVGIEDNLYFSRLFHKTMGMSPSEYRNNNCV